MEPIRHTLTAQIPVLRMYREDLDQLLLIFENAGAKVVISDKEYRYESLDDMKAHVGDRLVNIDIQAEHPAVHFLLNQSKMLPGSPSTALVYYNELRTEEISDGAENLFYRVRDFLVQHKAPRFRTSYLVLAIIAAVGSVMSVVLDYQVFKNGKISLEFLACLLAFVGFFVTSATGGNELILETRSNSPSFLKQNKNSIIMLLLGAGVGIVCTLTSQWLARLLFK